MITILKSLEEIEKIRKSSQIVAETLTLLQKEIAHGISTKKLDRIAEDFIYSKNAIPAFKNYKGYPFSICVSINEEVVHGFPSDRIFKEGDVVSIDCGAIVDGYCGDSAITVKVGEVSNSIDKLIDVGRECLYIGISKAILGNRLNDISLAIQTHANKYGFNTIKKFVGHGIGRLLHEPPQVPNQVEQHLDRGLLLKPGMVLAIEPMITSGSGNTHILDNGWTAITLERTPAVHWEHTIVITEDGPKILSKRQDEIV